jgi:hypothetical protein
MRRTRLRVQMVNPRRGDGDLTMALAPGSSPCLGMRRGRLVGVAGVAIAVGLSCDAAPTPIGVVPPEPDAGPTTTSDISTFAVNALFVGETDRTGTTSNTAWKTLGFDLDGLVTTKDSTDVCSVAVGAPRSNQNDGIDGIDNAWGSVLLWIVTFGTGEPEPSSDATGLIASGAWTLQLQVKGLSNDPHQTATALRAQAFVSGPSDGTPAFDTTTDWPVLPSSLKDRGSIAAGANVEFDDVYVTDGTLVARGASQPLVLPIAFLNYFYSDPKPPEPVVLTLRVHDPILSFDHIDPGSAANGTLAGVLETDETVDLARAFAHQLNSSMCGSAFDALADQIRQTQDILDDGTNAPGVPCDAISIGLGFTAKLVQNPTRIGVDSTPPADPCDGGT